MWVRKGVRGGRDSPAPPGRGGLARAAGSHVRGHGRGEGLVHGNAVVPVGHVHDEVHQPVAVAELVVVPAHELDELGRQLDHGLGVEDGAVGARPEVRAHHVVLRVGEHALEGPRRRGLDGRLDGVLVRGRAEARRQVHDGHVGRGHAEGHARELAVEGGDHLAHGLGRARGRGDDVVARRATRAPVLAAPAGAVHRELVGRHGVHRGHEALLNAKGVVDHLGKGRQAVGRAAGVGHDGHAGVVRLVVHAHDEHGARVLGGRRDDHVASPARNVRGGLLLGREHARGLAHKGGARLPPRDGGGVPLRKDADRLAVDDEAVLAHLHRAVEAAVERVVLEQVRHVVEGHEGVVDRHERHAGLGERGTGHDAADAAEAVDADLDGGGVGHGAGGLGIPRGGGGGPR
mmetsp:Transcript_20215/g.68616  ORF Transcript_20215/g.68616 Transcript_20215/m.68616 type:complete len:403 (-) Transcript_20215:9-1217(-)